MKACKSLCCALVIGLVAFGASVQGQEMEWVPVGATGPYVLNGNEIVLEAGGVTVQMDIMISGWGAQAGPPLFGAFNATIVGSSLLGDNCDPANSGCNIDTPVQAPCTIDGDCATGLCGNYEDAFCDDDQPAFIHAMQCQTTTSQPCKSPADCPGSEVCISNADFIAATCDPTKAVSLPANKNYEYLGACQSGGVADPDVPMYGGTLLLDVPGCAKGTYTVQWNTNDEKTFLNDLNAVRIPNLVITNGYVTVEIGSCCYNLGPGTTQCADNKLESECAIMVPGPRVWRPGVDCTVTCPSCVEDPDCKDPTASQTGNDNLCTANSCNPLTGICSNPPAGYSTATHCCDPDIGPTEPGLTLIDDFDPCTEDVCDPDTGLVTHETAPMNGEPCSDGLGCTLGDVCTDGVCEGTDVNGQFCDATTPCPIGECDTVLEECVCTEDTPLCIYNLMKVCEGTTVRCEVDDDCEPTVDCVGIHYPDGDCFDCDEGDYVTVPMAVAIGAGSAFVYGGQFMIEYDPECLDLDASSVGPCADSVFTNIVDMQIDEEAGTIWYAVTQDIWADPAEIRGPYDMMCMEFERLCTCDECEVCFFDDNPKNNLLTNEHGNPVSLINCICSTPIKYNPDMELTIPDDVDSNADCMVRSADISWEMASVTAECDDVPVIECIGASAFGLIPQADVDDLVDEGGTFPQGLYFFLCEATNICGDTVTDVWTVNVSDQQTLDVEVHLSPSMNPGAFTRGIEFQFYEDCDGDPEVVCEVMNFGGPYQFAAHASAEIKIPKGNYICLAAWDPLHTLRAEADLICREDGVWEALFKGDPLLGGNWLTGGNLNGCKDDADYWMINQINIHDFASFMWAIDLGQDFADGNTDCSEDCPHGDINADGAVDALDYSFLVENFLMASKEVCCPAPVSAGAPTAITEVSVKELRLSGNGELSVADLNGDGLVNVDDMVAYEQGVVPASQSERTRKSSSR